MSSGRGYLLFAIVGVILALMLLASEIGLLRVFGIFLGIVSALYLVGEVIQPPRRY